MVTDVWMSKGVNRGILGIDILWHQNADGYSLTVLLSKRKRAGYT